MVTRKPVTEIKTAKMLSSGGFSIYNFFIFKGCMGSKYKRIKKLNASILTVLRDSIFP